MPEYRTQGSARGLPGNGQFYLNRQPIKRKYNEMPILNLKNVISVIPTTNYDTAVNWYKKLIGRDADVVPTEGVSEWQLAANAWLQVGTDPDNSGNTTVVINVDDVEAQCAACEEAGIPLGEVVEYAGIVKMVDATDPDGNKITFVEELTNATAE